MSTEPVAADATPTLTRAERLDALVRKKAGAAADFHDTHKSWQLLGSVGDAAMTPQESIDLRTNAILADAAETNDPTDAAKLAATRDQQKRQAPYEILTLGDGQIRIALSCEDGDVISGTGADIDEALTALEGKLS